MKDLKDLNDFLGRFLFKNAIKTIEVKFSNGHTEYFIGSMAEFEQVLKGKLLGRIKPNPKVKK